MSKVARNAIGVLSTENRKTWSSLRTSLSKDRHNLSCLQIVDDALFIVCLDDATPNNLADLCSNFLCGTYDLQAGVQVGTCTNRWYDKVSDPVERYAYYCSYIFVNLISCKSLFVPMEQLASTSNILVSMVTPS